MKPREEYEAMPIEDRLNYAERAVALLMGEFDKARKAAEHDSKSLRSEAAKLWREGKVTSAIASDSAAKGAERCLREMNAILFRIRSWQGHSDTPAADLPFRLEP